jgi:hypothetical protein
MSNNRKLGDLANVLDDGTEGQVLSFTSSGGIAATSISAGTSVYDLVTSLPASAQLADLAYVEENKGLYLWDSSAWIKISSAVTPNTPPYFTTNLQPGYTLATDGTPLVLTLNAVDPEGAGLTFSYTVTKGDTSNAVAITQADNVFTITPSTDTAYARDFALTFHVTDGINTVNSKEVYFSLHFEYGFLYHNTAISSTNRPEVMSITNPGGLSHFGSSLKFIGPNELLIGAPNISNRNSQGGGIYIYDTSGSSPSLTCKSEPPAGATYGANQGISYSYDEDWIVLGTDEKSSNSNCKLIFYKRNADGSWPVTNGQMTIYQEFRTSNFGPSAIQAVDLDGAAGRCAAISGNDDDLVILHYNSSTNLWEEHSNFTDENDTFDVTINGDYCVTIHGSTGALSLYHYDTNSDSWSLEQSGYTSYRGMNSFTSRVTGGLDLFVNEGKLWLNYKGVGDSSSSQASQSYRGSLTEINTSTHRFISPSYTQNGIRHCNTNLEHDTANGRGGKGRHDYYDWHLSNNKLHVMEGHISTSPEQIAYRYFDFSNNTWNTAVDETVNVLSPTLATGTSYWGATVTMDPYTGRFAVGDPFVNSNSGLITVYEHEVVLTDPVPQTDVTHWLNGNATAWDTLYGNGSSEQYYFGAGLAWLKSDELFVSAPGQTTTGKQGGIYIYDTSGSSASLLYKYENSSSLGRGMGCTFAYHDDWLLVGTDEQGSDATPYLYVFKRDSNGDWENDGSGNLTPHQTINPSLDQSEFVDYVGPISINPQGTYFTIATGTGTDDGSVYKYNSSTGDWDFEFKSTGSWFSNPYSTAMYNTSVLSTTGNTTAYGLTYDAGGTQVWGRRILTGGFPLTTTYNIRFIEYNSSVYIWGVERGQTNTTTGYRSWICEWDVAADILDVSNAVIQPVAHIGTTPRSDHYGAPPYKSNWTHADYYIDNNGLMHIFVSAMDTARKDIMYSTFNFSTMSFNSAPLLIDCNDISSSWAPVTFGTGIAVDATSGKVAISDSGYGNMTGEVKIFKETGT